MVDGGPWAMLHSHQPSAMAVFLFCNGHLRMLLDDAAVEEVDAALGMPRVSRIVRDHANRRPGLVQLAEEVHHGLAAAGIEVSGRLVGEQNQRLARHGARDGDALLLTARELAREVLRA